MVHNGLLLFSFLLTAFSIAFFNFAGISVTKELSATTRMVLDSVRTLVIWAFSLAVSWQKFQYLQVSKPQKYLFKVVATSDEEFFKISLIPKKGLTEYLIVFLTDYQN